MKLQRMARLLVVPLLALLMLLAACDLPGARQVSQPPPATTTAPNGLPAFAGWRVAYVDQAARLHAVTADGKRDSTGPALPWYAPTGGAGQVSAVSPDGHLLAYVSSNQYYVLDLTGKRHLSAPSVPIAYDLAWSPDRSLLAVSDRDTLPVLYRPADGQLLHIPSALDRAGGLGLLRGWIGDGHLAYDIYSRGPDGAATSVQLAALDIASGQVRVIATFPTALLGVADFLLAPDGRQALLYNRQFRGDPFTPTLDVIDIASGQITPLPTLAQTMGTTGGLSNPVWQPGSEMIAVVVATATAANPRVHPWLLDVAHDSYTILSVAGFPLGWLPDQGPLILASGAPGQLNNDPSLLLAARCATDGQCAETKLTDDAWHYPFLGFVRTA